MKAITMMNNIYCKFKSLIKDEKGSVLPLIAVILILVIMIGAVNFSVVIMYRDRAMVRNAIDAGATSSLAAIAEEKWQYMVYGESLITTETASYDCEEPEEVGTDDEGDPIIVWVPVSYVVPRVQRWINAESRYMNYVQLDPSSAESVAKRYFDKNMDGNDLNFSLKSFDYEVTYDTSRKYIVTKNRDILRPDVMGSPPSWCNPGSPDIYNDVTNPGSWWLSDFAGANTPGWSSPSGWSTQAYEEKEVIFPRWVEVKATVTVELPIPFGNLLGRGTYETSFDVTAVKELVHATY